MRTECVVSCDLTLLFSVCFANYVVGCTRSDEEDSTKRARHDPDQGTGTAGAGPGKGNTKGAAKGSTKGFTSSKGGSKGASKGAGAGAGAGNDDDALADQGTMAVLQGADRMFAGAKRGARGLKAAAEKHKKRVPLQPSNRELEHFRR